MKGTGRAAGWARRLRESGGGWGAAAPGDVWECWENSHLEKLQAWRSCQAGLESHPGGIGTLWMSHLGTAASLESGISKGFSSRNNSMIPNKFLILHP